MTKFENRSLRHRETIAMVEAISMSRLLRWFVNLLAMTTGLNHFKLNKFKLNSNFKFQIKNLA